MKAQLQELLAQARAALDRLAPRERRLVLGGGGALLLILFYLVVWEPIGKAHERHVMTLERERATALKIENAAALSRQSQRRGGSQAPLLRLVDQSSRQATLGKPPSRVQPDGAGDTAVRVWFEDVPFDNLLRWLAQLQTQHGVDVAGAEIAAGAAPGVVNAQLSLKR